jgi:hypothetical protein
MLDLYIYIIVVILFVSIVGSYIKTNDNLKNKVN